MADDLERQHLLRQQLLHDVAHELRTPLTALQCRLETVIDGLARDPAQAVRDLHDDVRHLGIAGRRPAGRRAGRGRRAAPVDRGPRGVGPGPRGAEGCRARRRRAGPRRRARRPSRCEPMPAVSARSWSTCCPTPAGTRPPTASSQSSSTAADETRVAVRNTGSHLTPEECARVFDRFYRTDPSRQTDDWRHRARTGNRQAPGRGARGGREWADGVTFDVRLAQSTSRAPAARSRRLKDPRFWITRMALGIADRCHAADTRRPGNSGTRATRGEAAAVRRDEA